MSFIAVIKLATTTVDLSGKSEAEVAIPLVRFIHQREQEWRSANTHLHIVKLSREECDRYLMEIPAARLDVVFVSHLERAAGLRRWHKGVTAADESG